MNFKLNLENDKISLFQANKTDFKKLYSIANDPKIWEQHPENDRWKKNKFSLFFNNGLLNQFGLLIIFDKIQNKIAGSTRFYSLNESKNEIRIGFTFIKREYWGTRMNFYVKELMISYAFKFIDNIYFDIGNNNFRSRKAIEKIGAYLFIDKSKGNVVYKLTKNNFNLTL